MLLYGWAFTIPTIQMKQHRSGFRKAKCFNFKFYLFIFSCAHIRYYYESNLRTLSHCHHLWEIKMWWREELSRSCHIFFVLNEYTKLLEKKQKWLICRMFDIVIFHCEWFISRVVKITVYQIKDEKITL